MAASGYTPIQLYRTSTSGTAPTAGNLIAGELAINYNTADMSVWALNTGGSVIRLMNNPAGLKYPTVDGTANQVIKTDGAGNLTFVTPATGTVTSVIGTGTVSGLTLSGTVTSSGSLTLGGSITGFLPTAGGTMTGAITFAAGQSFTGTLPLAGGTMTGAITFAAGQKFLNWTIKTTTYNPAVAGDNILADTTSSAFTITLPASAVLSDTINIADYKGTFATNNLTINSNGLNLMGSVQTLILNVNYRNVTLVYSGATQGWVIVL
jgi:hypothetical protein